MNGLEKLTSRIKDGAKSQADEIIKEAQAQAQMQIETAEKDAETACLKIADDAKSSKQRILRGADSQGNLDGRKNLLFSRRKMIDAAFAKAKENLLALSTQEYFDFVLKTVKKIYSGSDAEIILNKSDIARMPDSFTASLAEISGGKIVLSTTAGDFDGGFVLKYAFLEENCTLDALLRQSRETLEDTAAKILFK